MSITIRFMTAVLLLAMIAGHALAQTPGQGSDGQPQQTKPIRVKDLGNYVNQYVVVEGISGQKRDDPARNTKVFLLVDDWNDSIWVRTKQDYPVIGIHYRVQGIVSRDGAALTLIEDSRTDLSESAGSSSSNSQISSSGESDKKNTELSQTALIGIGFIVVAVIIAAVLIIVMNKQKARERMVAEQQRRAAEMERERLRMEMERSSPPAMPPTGAPASATVVGGGSAPPPSKRQHAHTVEAWGQIKVATGPHAGMIVPLSGRQLSIGRSEGDLQLPDDPMVSSRHGEIVVTNDGRLLYVDNSRNGSQVDGKPVHRAQVEITTSSAIEIGGSRIEIIAARLPMPGASQPAQAPASSPALTMVGDKPPVSLSAKTGIFMGVELVVVTGPDSGKRIPVGKSTVTIGRRDDQDLVITDGFVSREHIVISQQGNDWILKNISEKGTIVNGEQLDEVTLKHGDRIAMGSTVIEFTTLQGMMAAKSASGQSVPEE